MKMKRILGAFLVLAMLVPVVLTGCGGSDEEVDTTDTSSIRQNIVLNMYILTEQDTDPEQAEKVEIALNEILLPEYRTVAKINYIKDDGAGNAEYWNAIDTAEANALAYQKQLEEERKAKKEAAKQSNVTGSSADETTKMTEEEAEAAEEANEDEYDRLAKMVFGYKDADGNAVPAGIVMPENQLDIFLVNDPNKYIELANGGRLVKLDDYLKREAKLINSYVYPTFITGAKSVSDGLYGIPVNKSIGNYEYLVFNKEYLDEYLASGDKIVSSVVGDESAQTVRDVTIDDLKTIEGLERYLRYIAANKPGVVPFALSEGGVSPQFFEYFNGDGSAIGSRFSSNSVFANSAFSSAADKVVKNHFLKIREYRLAGYIPATYNGEPFAVDIRKGYADSPEKWSEEDGTEYVCEIYKRPIASTENTLDAFFVVSTASRNPARAAEIISLFNTNPELVNMLQYGVKEEHYYLSTDEDGIQKINVKENGGYHMNKNYTGNQYIKAVELGETDRTEAYKQQNLDSILSLHYGFISNNFIKDELLIAKADEITKSYYEGLARGEYDVETIYAQVNAQLASLTVSDAEIDNVGVGEDPIRIARRNSEKYEFETYNAVKATEKASKDVEKALNSAKKAYEKACVAEVTRVLATVVDSADSAVKRANAEAVIANAYTEISAAFDLAENSVAVANNEADNAEKLEKEAEKFAEETTHGVKEAEKAADAAADNAKRVRAAKTEISKNRNSISDIFEQIKLISSGNLPKTSALELAVSEAKESIVPLSGLYVTFIPESSESTDQEEIEEETDERDETTVQGSEFDQLVYDIDLKLYEHSESKTSLVPLWKDSYKYFDATKNNNVVIEKVENPLKVIVPEK